MMAEATHGFNTQPPEGGWGRIRYRNYDCAVSTHSRLKAAGYSDSQYCVNTLFQHTAA